MKILPDDDTDKLVALLAEGVDRNTRCYRGVCWLAGRPPRGGRG